MIEFCTALDLERSGDEKKLFWSGSSYLGGLVRIAYRNFEDEDKRASSIHAFIGSNAYAARKSKQNGQMCHLQVKRKSYGQWLLEV